MREFCRYLTQQNARRNHTTIGPFALICMASAVAMIWWASHFPLVYRSQNTRFVSWDWTVGSFVAALFVALALWIFWRRRPKPEPLEHVLFLVGFPLWLVFYHALVVSNALLDRGAPQTHQSKIVRHFTKTGRGGPSFYLFLEDWREKGKTVHISVRRETAQDKPVGSPWSLQTKPGFWGQEWIVGP